MFRRPDEVTGAILAGRELGLTPMSALRSIDIIDGVPALRAVALRGLVQAQGHDVWVEESTDTRAIVCGRRRNGAHVERSMWTIDRAKRAGLAGKRNWSNYPAAMLVARATAEVCRLIAADLLIGMPYTVEELDDDRADVAPIEAAPSKSTSKAKRTVQRQPVDDPLPSSVDDQPVTVAEDVRHEAQRQADVAAYMRPVDDEPLPVDEQAADTCTLRQRSTMFALFRDAGMSDRDARMAFAATVVGRDLSSSKDLTKAEASEVIDKLKTLVEGLSIQDGSTPDDVA
jgi:hypothetical protein